MHLLIKWFVIALTLVLLAHILPGIVVTSFGAALFAGIVIGLINLIIRPLLTLITLPINILTLGLFSFVLNALLFWLAAAIVPGFEVLNFWYALLGSLILSLVYTLFEHLLAPPQQPRRL